MPDADPLSDLAIRKRQLETHLLQSHEYREKAVQRFKLLTIIKLVAFVIIVGEAVIHLHDPKPASPLMLGAIAGALFVFIACGFFLWRTWLCLNRLNERWLTPEAKKALAALRREQARMEAKAS